VILFYEAASHGKAENSVVHLTVSHGMLISSACKFLNSSLEKENKRDKGSYALVSFKVVTKLTITAARTAKAMM